MHYGTSYDNAFWDDACFCMTYGDGKRFKSMEAVDVTGHELAHGVCSKSANLTYNGESGGLNEASSDIFGILAKFYAKGGGYQAGASSIPATGGNWTMGEQVSAKPLRYLYKPSKDGRSLDAWGPGIGELDVHYSSGPMNRCFYFLSQGAAARAGDRTTDYLPAGMKGVGNQIAARIWYRTLTVYLTSQSDYAAARAAAIRAAGDLYDAGSLAEKAVRRAFHGINVGPDWSPVTAVILHPVADQVIFTGTTLAFEGSARDSAPGARLDYGWVFGDGGVAVGASASHTYRNTGLLDLVCPATFDVLDDQGNLGSDTRTITVTASIAARPERVRNGGFEDGSTAWEGDTQVIGAFQEHPPYAGQRNVLFTGAGYPTVQKLSQSVAIPAPVGSATLRFRLRIDTDQLLPVPLDYLRVQLLTGSGQLVQELAAYSNLDASPDYVLKTIDLSGLQGRALRLNFQANEGWVFKTSFALDDVSLIVR